MVCDRMIFLSSVRTNEIELEIRINVSAIVAIVRAYFYSHGWRMKIGTKRIVRCNWVRKVCELMVIETRAEFMAAGRLLPFERTIISN